MKELVDPTYALVLEISNGVGFVMSCVLGTTLLVFFLIRASQRGWWPLDIVAQLMLGMISVKVGLAVGMGYRWLVARCRNLMPECGTLEDDFWLLWLSILFIAVGGLVILRTVSRPAWRPWSWLATGAASVVIPFFYYSFDVLFPAHGGGGAVVYGAYHWDRVLASIAIAVLGSYTALDVARIAILARGVRKMLWISTAGVIMGGSIWSMHFVAMLAFELPGIAVAYDSLTTLVSFLLPVGFTTVAFAAMASSDELHPCAIVLSGLMVAAGVVGMHYTGIAAMEMPAVVSYDLVWVMVSVLVAVSGSIVAVWLVFVESTIRQRVAAALVMGVFGISGLHYSAMMAFVCRRVPAFDEDARVAVLVGLTQEQLAAVVVAATSVILLTFLVIAAHGGRNEQKRGRYG